MLQYKNDESKAGQTGNELKLAFKLFEEAICEMLSLIPGSSNDAPGTDTHRSTQGTFKAKRVC